MIQKQVLINENSDENNTVEDPIIINENGSRYSLADIKIHWFIVLAATIITVFLSIANNVAISEALKRGLYSGAVFWILAEIIDYIFSKVR